MLTQIQKERIRLLVDALRSGKYRQAKRRLSTYQRSDKKRKFCCLGVACEIARANGLELDVNRHQGVGDNHYYTYDGEPSTLPNSVREWFGFNDSNPVFRIPGINKPISAAELNDEEDWSLRKIADAFEAKYLNEENDDSQTHA